MRVRFVVTGMGRSGTMWLAKLLDRCDPTVNVHHEPIPTYDRRLYWRVRDGSVAAEKFIGDRIPRMERIAARTDPDYAEVNSFLRYAVPELKEQLGCPVVALARKKDDVVASLMRRGCFKTPGYPEVAAPDGLSQREACEWYWEDTYVILERVPTFWLGDLNSEFRHFQCLCEILGTRADREVWKVYAGTRINTG